MFEAQKKYLKCKNVSVFISSLFLFSLIQGMRREKDADIYFKTIIILCQQKRCHKKNLKVTPSLPVFLIFV